MSLIALGVNHKTAPVDTRERLAFAPGQLTEAVQQLVGVDPVAEAAILSTCNRTEIYSRVDGAGFQPVLEWLGGYHGVDPRELARHLYVHEDEDAVRHILRVASGLDSLVLGEPQILGQIKDAYNTARSAQTLGRRLNQVFQQAFTTAKRVRTDTAIGASPVSVAFAAVSLAKQIFGELDSHKALLIGAGETIELAARHLAGSGIQQMIVANRTAERAHDLATQFDGYAIALEEIPSHLHEADIVISSTAAPLPILGKGAVEKAIRRRKRRPMFMVDIAVPRDIEPQVARLDDVYLYTVDDLEEVIEENLRSRKEAANKAEEIIDNQVVHYREWLRSQDAVRLIREYRERAHRTGEELTERARRMIANGQPADEVLEWLAHTLTNKLLHQPTTQMRLAGRQGRESLIQHACELLDLGNED